MDMAIAIKAAILSLLASIGISAAAPGTKIQEYVKELTRKENHGAEVSVVAKTQKELKPDVESPRKASPTPTATPTPKPDYKNHGAEVSSVAKKDSLEVNLTVK